MPRKPRIDLEDLTYHIMVRGLDGCKIFRSDKDKDRFLEIVNDVLQISGGMRFIAWALMPNHIHFMVTRGEMTLSSFMRRILTKYASYFNRKYKRFGHLYQNRFKSVVVDEETYFLELIRYIHLNPIHANMVKTLRDLESYPYTGYPLLLSKVSSKTTIPVQQSVLGNFGRNRKEAIIILKQFMKQGINDRKRPDLDNKADLAGSYIKFTRTEDDSLFDSRVMGGGAFLEDVLERLDDKKARMQNPRNLKKLLNEESKKLGLKVSPEDFVSKNRKLSELKSRFVYKAIAEEGHTNQDLSNFLRLHPSNISRAFERYAKSQ